MDEHDPLRDVLDEDEVVAAVGEHPQLQLPTPQLVDQVADLRVVARAVDDARHRDDDRRALLDALVHELVRAVLGLVVVREEALGLVALEGLVDDGALRVAEDVAGRDVDDPRHARVGRRVEHALGAAHVRFPHGLVLALRHPDLVNGADVEDASGFAVLFFPNALRAAATAKAPPTDTSRRKERRDFTSLRKVSQPIGFPP